MQKKIGGCVILYNPETAVVSNIQTYCRALDVLYVIDNSPVQNTVLLEQIAALPGNFIFRWMGGNEGMGAALNLSCRLATEAGCTWLLTMDQDSSFGDNGLSQLIADLDIAGGDIAGGGGSGGFTRLAILSPAHFVSQDFVQTAAEPYSAKRFVMTSGNLLDLSAAAAIGPFEAKLFIDCIDMDYCLRLRKVGYQVVQDNTVQLRHSLGHFETGKLASVRIGYSNHNAVRRYYITRNKLYMLSHYWRFDPGFCWLVLRSMLGDTVRILFFEKEKGAKFRAIFLGCWHSLIGRYGVYGSGTIKKGGALT